MLGIVLSTGQTVKPGGVICGVPAVTLVSIFATLPYSAEALLEFGQLPPAPKLKLFWRTRSWKTPNPERIAILPLPNTSYAKPSRGANSVLAGENPRGTPEHGSQTSPSGDSAVSGSPTILPLFKSITGRLAVLY